MEQAILIYDGDCSLCGKIVGYIASRDKHGRFQLLPSQSQAGRDVLSDYGLSTCDPQTVVLIEKDAVFVKSEAILRATALLGGVWKFAFLGKLIPAGIRDFFYGIIARNRYFLSGRAEVCRSGEHESLNRRGSELRNEKRADMRRNSSD